MNSPPFLYTFPLVQQPYYDFPLIPHSTPYFLYNPAFSFAQPHISVAESCGINLPILPKYMENSDPQDTKLQTESTNKSQELREKRTRKIKGSKKYKIERLRDGKGRYSGVCKHVANQKYKQNPKRNVLTNIGNQLLAFASNRSRSFSTLKRISPALTEKEVAEFYNFVSGVRERTDYYLNTAKMSEIWYPTVAEISEENLEDRSLFRRLSYEYLHSIIRLTVLSSTKIKGPVKIFHIKAIKTLLQELTRRELH